MVRLIITLTLLSTGQLFSQNFELSKGFTTIRQGVSMSFSEDNAIHLNVGIEYFDSKNWSLKSQSNVFLTSKNRGVPTYRFDNLTGINGHIIVKSFDFFAGLQPGIQIIHDIETKKNKLSPVLAVSAGINYYSSTYFHLFTEVGYLTINDEFSGLHNDVRLSFGLGYNISQIYTSLKNRKTKK